MMSFFKNLYDSFFGVTDPKKDLFKYNPLNAKIGTSIKIKTIDYNNYDFYVAGVIENKVKANNKTHTFTDYIVCNRLVDNYDLKLKLRVCPKNDTFQILVLSLYDEFAFSEDFQKNVLEDESKEFIIEDTDLDIHEKFWRVGDVGIPFVSNQLKIFDENKDRVIQDEEIEKLEIKFWDYSRMTKIEGIETEEYVFVEMNTDNGWFEIWRGSSIIIENVEVF